MSKILDFKPQISENPGDPNRLSLQTIQTVEEVFLKEKLNSKANHLTLRNCLEDLYRIIKNYSKSATTTTVFKGLSSNDKGKINQLFTGAKRNRRRHCVDKLKD